MDSNSTEPSVAQKQRIHHAVLNNLAFRLFAIFVAAFCSFWTLNHIFRYGVSIPFWDEWDFLNVLRKLTTGELSWTKALLLRSGEHQLFVQFAFSAAGWYLTHMHLKMVMVWNWGLSALFCVMAAVITARELGRASIIPWLTLAVSFFFVFNPAAYQTLLWALAPVYSILSLSFMIGVYLCQSRLPVGVKIFAVALISLFASFVLGNALLFWIALPGILALYEDFRRFRRCRLALLGFAILLSLTITGYVLGSVTYTNPAPSAGTAFNAADVVLFFLAFTGDLVSSSFSPQPIQLAEGVRRRDRLLIYRGISRYSAPAAEICAAKDCADLVRFRIVLACVGIVGCSHPLHVRRLLCA